MKILLSFKIPQDSFHLITTNHSNACVNKNAQDSARSRKIRKRDMTRREDLLLITTQQDWKWPKKIFNKIQVCNAANLTPFYLRQFFSSLEPAPPPYTMESENTLQVMMEVAEFGCLLKNFFKQKSGEKMNTEFHSPMKSNLGRMQANKIDAEKLKREGWNNDGILVIKADDERLSWPEKELIKQIGDKIYKNKKGGNHGK